MSIPVTISVGVALLDKGTLDAGSLMRRADEKLYEAKSAGRNRVEVARDTLSPQPTFSPVRRSVG